MSRIFVLGNCQAQGLSDWMRVMVDGAVIENASIAGVAPGDPTALGWPASIEAADTTFCQLTDEQLTTYGLALPETLARAGKTYVPLPVVAFKGFQPDCTYVFTGGQPAVGAMGPYHSAIAAAAFLEGLSTERALGLFNTFAYAALGYFDEFDAACTVLKEKSLAMGLDLSAALQRGAPAFMHTINHPSISILGEIARQGLARAGLEAHGEVPAPHDHLGDSFRWPIYPEIAARLDLPGSLSFQRSNAGHLDVVDLRTLVEATYASLKALQGSSGPISLDQDRPMATPVIERAQAFIRRHVVR